jgi:hypothetical protein
MTAVALLSPSHGEAVAVLRCFHKMDAPLDESNINRFIKILEPWSSRSSSSFPTAHHRPRRRSTA